MPDKLANVQDSSEKSGTAEDAARLVGWSRATLEAASMLHANAPLRTWTGMTGEREHIARAVVTESKD